MTYKPNRYRLYPNDAQRNMLMCHFGSTRWVYNRYLSEADRLYFELGQYIKRDEFIVDLARLENRAFFLSCTMIGLTIVSFILPIPLPPLMVSVVLIAVSGLLGVSLGNVAKRF